MSFVEVFAARPMEGETAELFAERVGQLYVDRMRELARKNAGKKQGAGEEPAAEDEEKP